ncbi:DUF2470 domain-containing protein [Streptomyces sp. Pv4-95]|uniref:DUF2470 domain-containing protein n=1 Tax=Streptomyces sp. Pv4-95 TaxID=3049543 RepID=UPI003891D929
MKVSRRTEPTTAERARSILAAASSLTVTTEGGRNKLLGAHTVQSSGRLTLAEPRVSHWRTDLAKAPRGDLAAELELTDVAPIAVRRRVRARLTLRGHLSPRGPAEGWPFRPVHAALALGGDILCIDPEELAAAKPDPLARYEADLLAHLDAARTDTATRLAALLPAGLLLGVTRVRPVRLDRYGLVLRLEDTRGGIDARLPFSAPVSHCGQVKREIRTLLARAAAPSRPARRLRACS